MLPPRSSAPRKQPIARTLPAFPSKSRNENLPIPVVGQENSGILPGSSPVPNLLIVTNSSHCVSVIDTIYFAAYYRADNKEAGLPRLSRGGPLRRSDGHEFIHRSL